MNKFEKFPSIIAPKKKIRKCSICEADFEWNEEKGSCYYGYFDLKGEGYDMIEEEIILGMYCSSFCATKSEYWPDKFPLRCLEDYKS